MSISEKAADRLSDATVSAHLATTVEDRPHVAPVWFLYDDGHLFAFTSGRKLANVRKNPRVAASVEADQWHAVLQGTASIVEETERVREIGERLFEKYTGSPAADRYTDEDGTPEGTLIDVEIGSATVREN
ncbi:MAG: pyridoxamine 5'-phosphate oxidase family protein [Halovenus sp.]